MGFRHGNGFEHLTRANGNGRLSFRFCPANWFQAESPFRSNENDQATYFLTQIGGFFSLSFLIGCVRAELENSPEFILWMARPLPIGYGKHDVISRKCPWKTKMWKGKKLPGSFSRDSGTNGGILPALSPRQEV